LLEKRIARLKNNDKTESEQLKKLSLLGIAFILSHGGLFGRYYKQVIQRIEQDFEPDQIFREQIPMDVNVAKAVDMFTPAVLAMPNSSGSKAFVKLTEEILKKISNAYSHSK